MSLASERGVGDSLLLEIAPIARATTFALALGDNFAALLVEYQFAAAILTLLALRSTRFIVFGHFNLGDFRLRRGNSCAGKGAPDWVAAP